MKADMENNCEKNLRALRERNTPLTQGEYWAAMSEAEWYVLETVVRDVMLLLRGDGHIDAARCLWSTVNSYVCYSDFALELAGDSGEKSSVDETDRNWILDNDLTVAQDDAQHARRMLNFLINGIKDKCDAMRAKAIEFKSDETLAAARGLVFHTCFTAS